MNSLKQLSSFRNDYVHKCMSHAKTTVVINNDLGGGLALQYHCKSGDNNLKAQSLAPGGSSSFRFNPDVFGRTLYFCSFSWQNESHYFDIYVQKRDKEFERWTDAFSPLYFEVNEAMEVMATEEPCDIACTFGNGLLDIEDYPQAKHPYPFNDSVVIYIRHIGPGVCIGQAWQEGKELQQVPQRLCSDILMVKQYK
ncbi:unnamed protein product [Microthlaspi erraticum]|uniref:S-protein homolog n=1 Tax=Microthlaspi erraticum TaxID=1685480 RepID=A0A6D2KTM3_9BRAS|nr:unnamed protein product [Microthlaspi erraticum]